MELSQCIFTTGPKTASFPNPIRAKSALDELFTHSDGVSEPFFAELEDLGIRLPAPPLRVVSLVPGRSTEPFTLAAAERFAEDMRFSPGNLLLRQRANSGGCLCKGAGGNAEPLYGAGSDDSSGARGNPTPCGCQ